MVHGVGISRELAGTSNKSSTGNVSQAPAFLRQSNRRKITASSFCDSWSGTSVRNLDELFKPEAVVLIGAPRRGSRGDVLLGNMHRAGFKGPLMLVNPYHRSIGGAPVYRNVANLPDVPDLAVIAPPETVRRVIAELGSRGSRAAIVITANFGEQGASRRTPQQAALDAARLGPNAWGSWYRQSGSMPASRTSPGWPATSLSSANRGQ